MERGATLVEGDLSDDAAIAQGVEGADSVFHVGADLQGRRPEERPPELWRRTSAAPSACSTPPRPPAWPDRLRLDRQRLGQHARRGRGRDLSPPEGDDFVSYYDETKFLRPQGGRSSASRRARRS